MTLHDVDLDDERCREAFASIVRLHDQANETWRYVVTPAFASDHYIVSDQGRVLSLPRYRYYDQNIRSQVRHRKFQPGGLMRPGAQPSGYRTLTIIHNKEPFRTHVHRLVAWAFLGLQPQEVPVFHRDGNPANNQLENLAYRFRLVHTADLTLATNTESLWIEITPSLARDVRAALHGQGEPREVLAYIQTLIEHAPHSIPSPPPQPISS